MRNAMCFYNNFHRRLELAIFKILKSRGEVVNLITDKGNRGVFLSETFLLIVLYLFLIKIRASTEITSSRSMPILNTRDVPLIVGISRGTSCILFT